MKKLLSLSALCAIVFGATGCNRVKGEPYADKVNEKVVAKINKGEITSTEQLTPKFMEEIVREALKEMGFDPDSAKITQPEQAKFNAKIEKYKAEWPNLIMKKNTGK